MSQRNATRHRPTRCIEAERGMATQNINATQKEYHAKQQDTQCRTAQQQPRHATPRHATPRHATPRHATPRHATPRHATPRHTTPHHTTPHHTTPHHTTPHHTTPHHTTPHHTTPHHSRQCGSALQKLHPPLPTANRRCGGQLQEFPCPLPTGRMAVHCNASTAHCPHVQCSTAHTVQCSAQHQAVQHRTQSTDSAAQHRPCVTVHRRRQSSTGQVQLSTGPGCTTTN